MAKKNDFTQVLRQYWNESSVATCVCSVNKVNFKEYETRHNGESSKDYNVFSLFVNNVCGF